MNGPPANPLEPEVAATIMEAVKNLPGPALISRMPGHSNDIYMLQFNSDGSAFATGSKDDTLRVRAY